MKLTIVVTVYNEKDTITKAIEEAKKIQLDKEIIIIDNCSTDGTREILRGLNDGSLKIVYQSKNYGYGTSVVTGANLAQGDYLFIHNSDLEYDPACVYEMLEAAEKEGLDVVFGSRLIARRNESFLKILRERPFYLGTFITTFLINLFYGRKFSDIIGNRLYRTDSLKKVNPQEHAIGFDFEVVSKLCKYKYKIKEMPVKYCPRVKGKKVKVYDIIPAILTIFKIRFS